MEINYSKLEVYKPSSKHFFCSFACASIGAEKADLILRMVSSDGLAAGYYGMEQKDQRFELRMLYVLKAFRCRGIGSWLLKHAMGVAETKSGSHIYCRGKVPRDFFQRNGFREDEDRWVFDFYPE